MIKVLTVLLVAALFVPVSVNSATPVIVDETIDVVIDDEISEYVSEPEQCCPCCSCRDPKLKVRAPKKALRLIAKIIGGRK